ncbi:hypothetical protein ABH105_33375, partial [Mycolicibacterium smegmatis]
RAKAAKIDWLALQELGEAFPAMAQLANGNWVVAAGVSGEVEDGRVIVIDPLADRRDEVLLLNEEQFCANWNGDVLLIKRDQKPVSTETAFSFRWFVPELLRERRLFIDVAVAAILLYGLGLVVPIFFQLVIDKVLVHESFTTLYVLAAGAIAA